VDLTSGEENIRTSLHKHSCKLNILMIISFEVHKRYLGGWTDRRTDGQTDRRTDVQTDRQTEGRVDRHDETSSDFSQFCERA
jgi:hypothetical protein